MARSRVLEPSPIGLIGGVLAIISCFLARDGYDDSFDVPLQFLWDKDATGGVKLGIPLVIVAVVVALFSVSAIEPFAFLRRLGGVVLLAVTALFVVQLGRRIGWDNLSADNVDVGPTSPAPEASSRFSPPPDCGRSHAFDRDERRPDARRHLRRPRPMRRRLPCPRAGTPIRREGVSATGTARTGPSTGRVRRRGPVARSDLDCPL
jgi:hypothetical protein